MKKNNNLKIKYSPNIEYKFTTQQIDEISNECFWKNKDLREIKRVFKALAKM